jgi:long-chain fatty acid transport protein
MIQRIRTAALAASVAGVMPLCGGMALATEGYVALGYSAAQRGQGGTGVAQAGINASAANANPASVAGQGKTLTLGIEFFMPDRGYQASGTFFVAPGDFRSGREFFAIPDVSYTMPLENGTVLNFSAYGNGGLNTSYDAVVNPNCGPANGVFCNGPAGVSLSQVFLSVTWAGRNGPLSWGIAPTLAGQSMTVTGLGAFAGLSTNPSALTDQGADISTGFGLRAGVQYAVGDKLRFGLSGQTKFEMSKFDSYAGLFENGGAFDIPAQVTLGIAFDPVPDVTLLVDYQYIFYSGVPAVSNATNAGPLGAPDGAGFGWDDVGVIKLGAAWRQNDMMTWRAGYAHSDNPIGPEDVTLNILAPGVVQDHFTVGGSWSPTEAGSLDFAVIYVANNAVSGPETTPMGESPGSNVTIDMDQFAISLGWTYKF